MPHFTAANMTAHDRSRDYPTPGERESPRAQYPPRPRSMEGGSPHHQYQPPPHTDDRSRQPPVSLPPMRDPSGGYDHPSAYPAHPPSSGNGYAPPPPPPPGGNGYPAPPQNGQAPLPALHAPSNIESRSPSYPPHADDYYGGQRRPPPPYDRDYYGPYRSHPPPPEYYGRGHPGPHDDYRSHPPPRHEAEFRGPPRPYDADYANGGHPRNGYPYQQGPPMPPGPPHQQAAPRQRTSIACRYCRKRKIRCSGYQNAPGGRCINCARMNQECIFQPVSSSSTAAFVHVSAVPGGLPPGTPLYGAYGQPLPGGGPPASGQQAPAGPPPPPGAPPQAVQYPHPPPNPAYYQPPVRSPTDVNSPYPESDAASTSGRRRRRESEEGHERRLPPPNGNEEEMYRRSPVSSSNSPRSQNYPSQPPMPAPPGTNTPPVSASGPTPPQRSPATSTSGVSVSNGHNDVGPRVGSKANGTTPTPQPGGPPPPPASGGTSVMSVKNILGDSPGHDMDRSMLGRLNRGVR